MHEAAIFVRNFSEEEYQQHLKAVRAAAQCQALHIVAELTDKVTLASLRRPIQQEKGMQQLLKLCRQGTIQKVLVHDGSDLGNSKEQLFQVADELTQLGINIYFQNNGTETLEDGKLTQIGQFMFKFLAEFIRVDEEERRERIVYNQAEARRQGKAIGRPAGIKEERIAFLKKYPKVIEELQRGKLSIRAIAKVCGVSPNTVVKVEDFR